MQYFGSNNVEGVSWMEGEIRWVEVEEAEWRRVHGLVIPIKTLLQETKRKCQEFINNTRQ